VRAGLIVLLSTRNRQEKLPRCLALIEAACRRIPDAGIVVIDNGSTDGTAAWLAEWVRAGTGRSTLSVPGAGKSRAINFAAARIQAELLAFTDDDVEVTPAWLSSMQAFMHRHPEYAAATGPVEIPPEITEVEILEALRLLHFGLPFWREGDDEHDVRRLVGANLVVRTRAFAEVGGYDERLGPGALGFYDDDDLGERLRRAGMRLGYNPTAVVRHEVDPKRLSLEATLARAVTIARCRSTANPGWLGATRAGGRVIELAVSLAVARLGRNRSKEIERRVRFAFFWETFKRELRPAPATENGPG
jgi:GT2 family glycosyltransferase